MTDEWEPSDKQKMIFETALLSASGAFVAEVKKSPVLAAALLIDPEGMQKALIVFYDGVVHGIKDVLLDMAEGTHT